MQIDPIEEWQRLTAEYREKYDGELLELAHDYADLTQPAQQALSAEMRSRGLGDPANPSAGAVQRDPKTGLSARPATDSIEESAGGVLSEQSAGVFGFGSTMPRLVPDTPDTDDKDDGPHEYTWKTPLCECETSEQAQQLVEALRKAGIDGWVDDAGSGSRYSMSSLDYPRVLVAADQLNQARAIAAQPIPREIIEEEKEEVPDFVEPKCPKCGSDDVVLEGVDPENTWRCEQCDAQWTENLPQTEGKSQSN
jgi:hypothetical protein